jgi:ubiquitin-like protein ATG12
MSAVEVVDETNSSTTHQENDGKIVFYLKSAGGAPILKRKKWALSRSKTIGYLAEFLKKHLQLDSEQQKQLFLYVNQAFSPAIDTTIGAVNDCFHSDGTLVLHYTITPAWG